ncbi:MAG: MAE_28990/MAE_18760 family HEPN-like nuclease [Devosia sp.]
MDDFAQRRRQVRQYLSIVLSIERSTPLGKSSRFKEARLMTVRAGTFLLLYNLIEATLRGAIGEIRDEISAIPFGTLSADLRKEIVRLFRSPGVVDPHLMQDVSAEFVPFAFTVGVKMSGSVDARSIREFGKTYGFSCNTDNSKTAGGIDLLTIKDNRNDLAHGLKTFEEVGRDYPAQDLVEIVRRSTHYMAEISSNVEQFLDAKAYVA